MYSNIVVLAAWQPPTTSFTHPLLSYWMNELTDKTVRVCDLIDEEFSAVIISTYILHPFSSPWSTQPDDGVLENAISRGRTRSCVMLEG